VRCFQDVQTRPSLSLIEPTLRKEARKVLRSGADLSLFFGLVDSRLPMLLFLYNGAYFHQRGRYEAALFEAWVNQKTTRVTINGDVFYWGELMRCELLPQCDRLKLLAAGDPLPASESLTVYRAIGDKGNALGVSWTLSEEVARRFEEANRILDPGDVRVLTRQVRRDEVWAYVNESGRNEQEIILLLNY